MVKKRIKITERGWGGHFIGSHDCIFRRNTLVEYGEVGVVVSTVGGWRPGGNSEFEEVRPGAYYETMAFWADRSRYRDTVVGSPVEFDSPWTIAELEDDLEANHMHDNIVAEIAGKLESGDLKFEV